MVPLGAFTALRSERQEQTLELITLTALSPRRVVIGKLLAQGVKLATLFAGLAPFIAMSFLLGGVDFATILVSMLVMFMWSLCASAACLFLSSLVKSRAGSGFVLGVIGIVLLLAIVVFGAPRAIYFLMMRGGMVGSFSGGRAPGDRRRGGRWRCRRRSVSALIVNLVLLAENRLLLPSENRSTALRLGFLAQLSLMAAWALSFIAEPGSAPSGAGRRSWLFGAIHLAVVAMFTVTEDLVLPPRVRLRQKGSAVVAQVIAPLQPGGWQRRDVRAAADGAPPVRRLVAGFTGPAPLVRARLRLRLLFHRRAGRSLPGASALRCRGFRLRVAVLVLLPGRWSFPTSSPTCCGSRTASISASRVRHLLNPFRTLVNFRHAAASYGVLAELIGVTGVLAYVVLIRIGAGVVTSIRTRTLWKLRQVSWAVPTSSLDWSAIRAAAGFRLAMPRTPIGGRVGERLGSGTGSSLEFQDYRPYAPGDDLRHVDWAAYARSETAGGPPLPRGGRPAHRPGGRYQPIDGGDGGQAPRLRRAAGRPGLRVRQYCGRHTHRHDRRDRGRNRCTGRKTSSAFSAVTRASRRSRCLTSRCGGARCALS